MEFVSLTMILVFLVLFVLFILIMRLIGAWMLRINEIISLQRQMLSEIKKLTAKEE